MSSGQLLGDRLCGVPRSCASGIFLFFLLLSSATSASAQERVPRVLMLHAYNYTFAATTIAATAARQRLINSVSSRIDIDADFLDLIRSSDPDHEQRTAAYLAEKYAANPPDVIVTLGSAALPFIMRHRASIAPKAPVVFLNVSPANYANAKPPPDITGIISQFDIDKTLDLAERLQPTARRLVVITGASETDRRWQEVAPQIIKARKTQFETTYLFGLRHADLLDEVSRLPRDTIVLTLSVFTDGEGKSFFPTEVGAAVASVSPAPVYSPYSTFVGKGVVGGYSETFESAGEAAADMVLKILSGANAADLPPMVNPNQNFRVDARALNHWGLSETRLPPETIVEFREPTVWTQYRELVLAALAIFVLQSLFLAALLIQRRRRYQAERMLRESEERMQFTATAAKVALWHVDRATDTLWASEQARAMFGLAPDDSITRETLLSAVHPDDLDIAIDAIEPVGEANFSPPVDFRVAVGEQTHWVRSRCRSHDDNQGSADRLSGVFVDITEQRTAEAETALQRRELAHLTRVSAMGELSGAIAHEINQPLTAILANAQAAQDILAQRPPNLAEIAEILQDIVQADNRAGEVVHRIRNLMKKGESTLVRLDINEVVTGTAALLRNEMIGRRVRCELELAPCLPVVLGDSVQLQQVIMNLVMNAMDAMNPALPARRIVTIRTRETPAGMVAVEILDRGPGVDEKTQRRMFEPFFTTKEHGLGLGLAICSSIVDAHGGKLKLTNHDSGAVASFALPPQQQMAVAAK